MMSLVRYPARPVFLPRIDDSHFSFTAVHCFGDGFVGKQPVAWKEYFAEYRLKELKESMDRYTGCQDITEILLKTALNNLKSINHNRTDTGFLSKVLSTFFLISHASEVRQSPEKESKKKS